MSFQKTPPSYSGDGIAIWEGIVENGDNKGKTYLKVKVLGSPNNINCFQVEQEKKE